MAFTPGDPDSLSGFIDDNWKKYNFKENPQQFLPRKALDEATTIPIIEEFVRRGDLGLSPSEAVSFAHRVNSGAPKLFILCIYCDLGMKFLKGLIDKQLTDDNLPLSANDCPIPKQQRHFNSAFLTNQKCFKVATFNMNSDQALNNTCTIPIEHTDNRKSLLGKGAFGEVYKIKIDKDYYSFEEDNNDGTFAAKVVRHEASSDREKNFNSAMAGLTHPNLVHCLASFTFGADTYLIYPLAEEGNLEEFMEKYRRPNTEFTQSWLVTQLRGLAAALLVIHDQEEAPTAQSHLRVEQAASGRTGYVHDIKPENILVIIRKGQIILFRLSDFSCAKVVEFITSISGKRDTHLTVSKSGTPNYRPPESQTGKTSRPYDLWSLGCVYLELLTWFVEGYEALEAFREARFGFVCPGKIEDEGFYFSAEGGENANWRLRNAVITKLNVLRPKCEGALKEILDVIPFLLSINPKQRMTAAKLAQTLKISGSSLGSTGERKRVDSVHMEEGSPLQDPASPADESNFVAGGPEITVTTH